MAELQVVTVEKKLMYIKNQMKLIRKVNIKYLGFCVSEKNKMSIKEHCFALNLYFLYCPSFLIWIYSWFSDQTSINLFWLNFNNQTWEWSLCDWQKCDRSADGRLDHEEIEVFCRELLRRPELDAIFIRYSANGCVLSTVDLRDFLQDQGEDSSLTHAQSLILTYELNEWGTVSCYSELQCAETLSRWRHQIVWHSCGCLYYSAEEPVHDPQWFHHVHAV